MQSKVIKYWLAAVILLAAAAGCAIAPMVTEMTPPVAPALAPAQSGGKTLQVMPLQEGDTWETNISKKGTKVENYQEALVRTLRQTGLFQEVFTTQAGDYMLKPALISFDVHPGTFSCSINLFINYRLIETKSGREVWKENLYSQGSAGLDRGLYKGAYEEAVRNNLAQLAGKLANLPL